MKRVARAPEKPLPVEESLLADREEHIIHRDPGDAMADDNPFDFRLDVPEHKYNLGEVYTWIPQLGLSSPSPIRDAVKGVD